MIQVDGFRVAEMASTIYLNFDASVWLEAQLIEGIVV